MRHVLATRRRKVVAALAVLAIIGGTTAAVAAWLTTVAQPPSQGAVGQLTVTATAPTSSPTNTCWPGQTCDGNIRLTNTSGAALKITGYTGVTTSQWDTASSTVTGASGACTVGDITLGLTIPAKTSGLNIAVPSGPASDITIPGLYAVASSLPSGCQGATFKLVALDPAFKVTVSQ